MSEEMHLDSPCDVHVVGDYAYIRSRNSGCLEIVDISDVTRPIHWGHITHEEFKLRYKYSFPELSDKANEHINTKKIIEPIKKKIIDTVRGF